MGKFSKAGGREMPELNTSSLPDLVFAFLFFIMFLGEDYFEHLLAEIRLSERRFYPKIPYRTRPFV